MTSPESKFALVAHPQHQNSIGHRIVAVERNVAGPSARDEQFSEIVLDRASDERMVAQ
jgi:hypothetical protein